MAESIQEELLNRSESVAGDTVTSVSASALMEPIVQSSSNGTTKIHFLT
jgi:hypothetical protein